MSLATITEVDASVERRKIHRRRGKLVFHSEAERKAWLWGVAQYEKREHERVRAELVDPIRSAERKYA